MRAHGLAWLGVTGLAFLFSTGGAWAQTAPADEPAAVASAPGAQPYRFDPEGYVRLRVTVQYADRTDRLSLTDGCDEDEIWTGAGSFAEALKGAMRGRRTFSIGIVTRLPNGVTNAFAPVRLETTRSWGRTKCNFDVDFLEYVSPLFPARTYSQSFFEVEPAVFVREGPGEDFTKATRDAVSKTLVFASVPAVIADQISGGLSNSLEGSGLNQTASLRAFLGVQPRPGAPETRLWEATTGLSGEMRTIVISASLENVASMANPGRAFLSNGLIDKESPAGVLSAPLLTQAPGGVLQTLGNLPAYASPSTGDLTAFNAADTAAEADNPCRNLGGLMSERQVSAFDQSLVLWALARTHPKLGEAVIEGKNLDQTSCLRSRRADLARVGIELRPSVAHVTQRPPTLADMRGAIELDNAFWRFFTQGNSLQWSRMGDRLFMAEPQLNDPDRTVFTERPPEKLSEWRFFARSGEGPMLSRVGCYAYFPASAETAPVSEFWAIGAGEREVAMRGVFANVPEGEPAKLAELRFLSTLTRDEVDKIQARRGRVACGDDGDWRPALLFGP